MRLGFVGLGNMGGRIATRLVEQGHDVWGYDTNPAHGSDRRLPTAATLRELVEGSDLVLLSLPDSKVVEAVVRAEDGVLACCRRGQIVVDLSTASPASSIELHRELAERGAEFLDAGVSGGAAAAEKGTLAIMVGGSATALDQARPALEGFSSKIFHMGSPGAGHTTKLLNNFLNAVTLAATSEVMVAGRKAGLDLAQLVDVLNVSSGASFATANRFPNIVRGDYMEGGLTSRLQMKDVSLYLELIGELGVPSLNAAGPTASFGLALQLGYGDEISNRVVDAIGDAAGGVRVSGDE
jgi:3-hydroxyisobutyrate dehydrogenase-like beta-hydroxyacid dehydrogenase